MQKSSIQFFGLPGSGKTYTLKKCIENDPQKYTTIPYFSKTKRFFLVLQFVAYYPQITFLFLRLIISNKIALWRYLIHLVSISFASHMYVLKEKETNKIVLIDEGVFQRFLSVARYPISDKYAEKVFLILKVLDTKVVIKNGGDFGRFVNEPDRMISPRNKLGEKYFQEWASSLVHNFNMLSRVIKDNNYVSEL